MKNIVWLFAVFVLSACDQLSDQILIDSKNLTTTAPSDLRALERNNLSANITLNGDTTTHQGSEHPTGDWQIPIDVEAGQTYDLSIQWRFNKFLLMEETGSFTVDEDTPVIRPELDFTNSGDRAFDNDCDGQSNLVEIKQGSDPQIAETVGDGICLGEPNESIELTDSNQAFASSFHDAFGQESQNRIIERFEQPLQIRKSANLASRYGFNLYSADEPPVNRVTLTLQINEAGAREAQVLFSRALEAFESSFTGSRCFSYLTSGISESGCLIPFLWEDNVWYSLVLELNDDRWTATVRNLDTGTEDEIGSFTASDELRWLTPQISMNYADRFTAEACSNGVLPIRAHFRQAIVNTSIFSEPLRPSVGACVGATGYWNFSGRPELEQPLFALEMGRPD